MPGRIPFSFSDITHDCTISEGVYQLDNQPGQNRRLGIRIHVPQALHNQYPYNASAYAFLQQLRKEIFECGLIELPGLPLNPTNHTLAQAAPWQHLYSTNPYMTDYYQSPHQDTPPYPTAFWLNNERRYFATWVISSGMAEAFYRFQAANPGLTLQQVHRHLVAESLSTKRGLLLNRNPGLLLIDNSQHQQLYHARTCLFDSDSHPGEASTDSPSYAYNEIGLLNYIDTLDSRRGQAWRDETDRQQVIDFMRKETG